MTGEINLTWGHQKSVRNDYGNKPKEHECAEGCKSRIWPDFLTRRWMRSSVGKKRTKGKGDIHSFVNVSTKLVEHPYTSSAITN